MRTDLPTGTVTFLFTDVEGSTRLLHALGAAAYAEALAEHRAIVRQACTEEGGVEVDTQGDAFFFAFPTAPGAIAAASALTEALASGPISVRVGVHTGTPFVGDEGYVGADVHRAARIAAAGHGGQIVVSSATAALVPDDLRDLGDHRFKDLAAPERVYQLGDRDFAPLNSLHRTNLPVPATPFLGRERELADVASLLANGARVVTLTGPGGTGKTRLALQAAAEVSDSFPDGVTWVPLATLRDPALVLPTVAQSLSVREGSGASAVDAVGDYLSGKQLLLVLDNCEQVIDAASELSQLVSRASNVKLLVTSRETLRVQGEVEYLVPTLASREAIALFCERARVAPSETIAQLCSRLDELPLAIELAAARLKLLTPEQLLGRLSQRLDLLKGGRDADPRQRTLRATIAWSHELLAEEERVLFRRLSAFRGGCTLEAAEKVCGAELETLESLLDKSLLRRRDGDHGSRYWMLETIREYAAERLDAAGETDELRERHADFFLALAEELEPGLVGYASEGWTLMDEIDNVRSAIEHLSDRPDPERELRLVGALFRFWEVGGWVAEGLRVTKRALARAEGAQPALRLKLLYAAATCASRVGDWTATEAYDRERLELARTVGDQPMLAVALNDLAIDLSEAGDLDGATALLDECVSLASSIGENEILSTALDNLASFALLRGDHMRARELSEESQRVDREGPRGTTSVMLAFALLGLGELERAVSEFDVAIEHARGALGPVFVAMCLDGFAAIALARGDGTRAACLAGAAQRLRADVGIVPDALDRSHVEANETRGRAALGDEAWEAALAEGEAMTLDEAVAYALEDVPGAS